MNCIIIEDQPPAQRILKRYIEDMGSLQLKATFSDAIEAMDYLKSESVDLIFLDIHLPKISGIDLLATMQHLPSVILTTAFPDYALESYEFSVVDYLLKPFSFQRFVKAVSKVPTNTQTEPKQEAPVDSPSFRKEFFIKSGYEHIKIAVDDIRYIKSDADYTEVFVSDKKYLSSESLRFWLENLSPDQFARIHKSYIINISKIEKIVGNLVYLPDKIEIPIGRAYKDDFIQKYVK